MTTRSVVTTERPPAFFPVPHPNTALVRAHEPSFPVAFPAQSQAVVTREQAADNAMWAQMLELAFRMGQDSNGSDEEARRLTLENKELRQHIIQCITGLENKWLGAAERLCAKGIAIT